MTKAQQQHVPVHWYEAAMQSIVEKDAEIERLQAVIDSHHEFFEGAKANLNDARNLIATLRAELREAGLLR